MTNELRTIIKEAAHERFATKAFDPEKLVSEEDFELLIDIARYSPSSCGTEPWKVLNIKSQEVRDKLFPISWGAQRGQLKASHYIVILSAKQQMFSEEEGYVKKMLIDTHHYPEAAFNNCIKYLTHMYDNQPEETRDDFYYEYSAHQAHIMAMNICANAALMGIDTCMIGGFDRAAIDKLLGEEMDLYDTKKWSGGLCVAIGYRAKGSGHGKARKPMEEFIQDI